MSKNNVKYMVDIDSKAVDTLLPKALKSVAQLCKSRYVNNQDSKLLFNGHKICGGPKTNRFGYGWHRFDSNAWDKAFEE
jgi:hypothetical protein